LIRQRAVTLQQRFRLCVADCALSVPPGAYSIERDAGTFSAPAWVSDTGALTQLPPDVQLTATATPLFSPNGMAQPVSTFTLTNPLGTMTVTVAATGMVQVCEGMTCPTD
jgi:type II secretion system GspH-like protein